jgi:hypothetical protein
VARQLSPEVVGEGEGDTAMLRQTPPYSGRVVRRRCDSFEGGGSVELFGERVLGRGERNGVRHKLG